MGQCVPQIRSRFGAERVGAQSQDGEYWRALQHIGERSEGWPRVKMGRGPRRHIDLLILVLILVFLPSRTARITVLAC
eukprot:scaffold189655_cov31-Tisochrysis_lutea.AAC.2